MLRIMQQRPLELPLSFQFMPRRWYHVVLTHSPGGALSASLVHLFVDGTLEASGKFRFPKVGFIFVRFVFFWVGSMNSGGTALADVAGTREETSEAPS